MRILFVHRGFPGQYLHLARHLVAIGHEVVGLYEAQPGLGSDYDPIPGAKVYPFVAPEKPELALLEERSVLLACRRTANVASSVDDLLRTGFCPDLICAHIGSGEPMFLKDLVPQAKLLAYCEYLPRPHGSFFDFDRDYLYQTPPVLWTLLCHGASLTSLALSDAGVTPTHWQHGTFPSIFGAHIRVIHDGIDTDKAAPGQRADEELVTYVSRSLEPVRGFNVFMRAVPEIQRRRPNAHIVVVGSDTPTYPPLASGLSFRVNMLRKLDGQIDLSRITFAGVIPFSEHLALLRKSWVHVYLTYPYILSWSALEAMSSGCIVVGSRTPPVEEVIQDGVNGLLVDFFDHEQLAAKVVHALEHQHELEPLRQAARRTVLERYDLKRICLPAQVKLIEEVMAS